MTFNSNSTRGIKFAGRLLTIAAFALAIFMTTSSFAEGLNVPGGGHRGFGGFSGPGPELVTVQQALNMRDDSRVAMKGNLVKSLGDEMYIFQDATGSIEVEIDNDEWHGQNITPSDVIIINGEVDKEWSHTYIDVSSVIKQNGGAAPGANPQ